VPALDEGRAGRSGGWRAARPFLAWGGGPAAAAVLLFWCYLRLSQTSSVNADGSGIALQGWAMLHGNVLLSGWWLADVSFYAFETPVDALVEAVHGLNADVVHIAAALIYMLLVLTSALLARSKARGAEGLTRALIAAGVLVAPVLALGTRVLILSPDHTGVAVPILLALLLMDRARERWWAALAVCALLIWAQLDDPIATFAAAVPIALVCLARAAVVGLLRRRIAWYDVMLGVAAAASYELTHLIVSAIRAHGGFTTHSLQTVAKLTPYADWAGQIRATGENLLILFGADFYEQPSAIRAAIAYLHFAGLALAFAGMAAGIVGLVRGADRVTQILTVAAVVTLVAGSIGTKMIAIAGAHEIAIAAPFGAVLAGRTIGPWVLRHRLPKITLLPVLGVVLACYLAALGYGASWSPARAQTQGLADWLVAHHLTNGLGRYWAANSTTLASGGKARVAAVSGSGRYPRPWVTDSSWYDPAQTYANFVVALPGNTGNAFAYSESSVQHVFGKPDQEYQYGPYVIMVWNKNLLLQVRPLTLLQVEGAFGS